MTVAVHGPPMVGAVVAGASLIIVLLSVGPIAPILAAGAPKLHELHSVARVGDLAAVKVRFLVGQLLVLAIFGGLQTLIDAGGIVNALDGDGYAAACSHDGGAPARTELASVWAVRYCSSFRSLSFSRLGALACRVPETGTAGTARLFPCPPVLSVLTPQPPNTPVFHL